MHSLSVQNTVISCANGTDALKLMLMGELAIGNLQKGDEVIVPANTLFRYRTCHQQRWTDTCIGGCQYRYITDR